MAKCIKSEVKSNQSSMNEESIKLWKITVFITVTIVIMIGSYSIITEGKVQQWHETVIPSIVKISGYSDYRLTLTNTDEVWLIEHDYVCRLDVPDSIDIYVNTFLGGHCFILTKEMSIIGINMNNDQFRYAINIFSAAHNQSIRSILPVRLFDKCELIGVGSPLVGRFGNVTVIARP